MKKKDLEEAAGISHYVMTKMSKNEDVSTEALRKICRVLNCKPEDVMEFTDDMLL